MTFVGIKKLSHEIIKHKAIQNFIIIALISLLQIVSNVLLGRGLSKDDFGKFSFIINNIISVFSVLFLFGQISTILRLFSSRDIQEFQWKKKLISFLLLIIVLLVVASYLVVIFYQLTTIMFVIVLFGSFFACCTMILAGIFRSKGKFNTAVLIERTHSVVFFIILLYTYFILKNFDLTTISLLKLISFSFVVPLLVYILLKWKEGPYQIKKNAIFEGLTLWEMSLTVLVLTNIDAFFIVKILDYKEMALYSIIGSVMVIFNFAREAIFSVYSQKFAKIKDFNSIKVVKIIILISIVLTLFFIISTNFILQILFGGKYSASYLLVILFCIYNTLFFLYVIPSCYFMGQGIKLELRKMMAINIISVVLKISLIFLFSKFGLTGFLFASIISQGLRTAGGYYISFKKIL